MADRPWLWAPNWLLLGLANQWIMVWLNMGHFNLLVVLLIAIWWQIALRIAASWQLNRYQLIGFILLILVPSASLKALACLMLVATLWRRGQSKDQRAVLQIVFGFTVAVLWGQQVFALLSGPVLALDAWGVSKWLQLLGWQTYWEGNRIERIGGHSLIVLKGCSSFAQIYLVVLAWLVSSCWLTPQHTWRQRLPLLLFVCVLYIGANQLRLVLMSVDVRWYRWLHSGSWAQLYQWTIMMIIMIFLFVGGRHERSR
ncbi:hypothetical protein CUC53_03365 [Aeromonas cavernicola]|uniref:Exosortase/archaeosortase family protein n=1 Tax=Aeromonas cavernicola TaxID=1006623 RepID=A0A2H9U850_9GAMM|nr:archaeosortase/exosortase family protein [Aeromonas cavernicola]PJG60178.1 hypothetical protein CUC53_03365 [Aeromonas cavernicola]